MKGIVFSFKNSSRRIRGFRLPSLSDVRFFLKRYGALCLPVLLLLLGLFAGSLYAQNASQSLLDSLDFLFTTNLKARLSQNIAETFCACFASNFIFIFTVFLLGFAPWGIPFILLVPLFKGFGTGLTAGYLFLGEGFGGVGFYLLVLLPGTFLFCIALAKLSSSAFYFSKRMFMHTISKYPEKPPLRGEAVSFCSAFMSALIITFCSSLLDTALWTLFAGAFNF